MQEFDVKIYPNDCLFCRYILTQYLVVIWAVNGIRAKKMDDAAVPQDIKDFIIAILVIAVLTFVVRVAIVIEGWFARCCRYASHHRRTA